MLGLSRSIESRRWSLIFGIQVRALHAGFASFAGKCGFVRQGFIAEASEILERGGSGAPAPSAPTEKGPPTGGRGRGRGSGAAVSAKSAAKSGAKPAGRGSRGGRGGGRGTARGSGAPAAAEGLGPGGDVEMPAPEAEASDGGDDAPAAKKAKTSST